MIDSMAKEVTKDRSFANAYFVVMSVVFHEAVFCGFGVVDLWISKGAKMIGGAVKHQNMSCVTRHILARKDKVGIIDN